MKHIEAMVKRSCTWAICLCHHAELPFRELFKRLDGPTTGWFFFIIIIVFHAVCEAVDANIIESGIVV